ncbi:hypothetical protein F511_11798 [Dorcoceras hygrometricum]|uniref:Uncharacterized protein n=1 Tax=Dorcoceras hygrometricum TaxID=472368 RepID=A0A2Z7CE32_9LAMI|nr:hypothetical protein F511_11798 [Dorcoceras hygrometricum]
MEYLTPATTLKHFTPLMLKDSASTFSLTPKTIPKSFTSISKTISRINKIYKRCRKLSRPISVSGRETQFETEEEYHSKEEYDGQYEGPGFKVVENGPAGSRQQRERRRYRKQYPGEAKGITEEMRFVTMKLRTGGKRKSKGASAGAEAGIDEEELRIKGKEDEGLKDNGGNGGSWEPSMEGFLKYLVDSKLIFDAIEHIVDESSDVSYVYFRKTGLERSDGLSKDLEWLRLQGNVIPQPGYPGTMYARYLKELAEKCRPMFLCHFYNIYFSHIAGGQVIAKQVSERLLEGRELEFCRWEGDEEELLRGVREKLNAIGEHWSRDEKNKCLREATKTFRFLGQIDFLAAKAPKKSPLILRMVVLFLAVICGMYIFSICLNQTNPFKVSSRPTKIQVISRRNRACRHVRIQAQDTPYVHFPNPETFSRQECACNPVRFFAIVSMQRSGSGWFETLLNSHVNLSSNGEIFGAQSRRSNASVILKTLDKVYNLDWFSSASKNECSAAVGFKWMLNQGLMKYHEEIADYMKRRGVSIIFLFRRNPLRRMISLLANIYDKDAKLLNGTHKSHVHSTHDAQVLARYKPTLNVTVLISDLKAASQTVAKALEYFKTTRHILLYYEDVLTNHTKLVDVQEFLKLPRRNLTSLQPNSSADELLPRREPRERRASGIGECARIPATNEHLSKGAGDVSGEAPPMLKSAVHESKMRGI